MVSSKHVGKIAIKKTEEKKEIAEDLKGSNKWINTKGVVETENKINKDWTGEFDCGRSDLSQKSQTRLMEDTYERW